MKRSWQTCEPKWQKLWESLRNGCLNLILSLEGNPAACWGTWSLAQSKQDQLPQLMNPQKAPVQLCNSTPLLQLTTTAVQAYNTQWKSWQGAFLEATEEDLEQRLRSCLFPPSSSFTFFYFCWFGCRFSEKSNSRKQVSRKHPEMWQKYSTASKETVSATVSIHTFARTSLKAGAERHFSKAFTQISPNLVKRHL